MNDNPSRPSTDDAPAADPAASGAAPTGSARTDTAHTGTPGSHVSGISRRRLLGVAGAGGAVGLAVGAAGGASGHAMAAEDAPPALASLGSTAVMFHGKHQAGITTPLQARGHLAAFDLVPGADRKSSASLMRRWTRAAAAMAEGRAPDDDNQIALDAGPSSLTVTFGFGASFLKKVGLEGDVPRALEPLPPFSADALDGERGNGDLFVQIGSDDALVAFHALRVLQRLAHDTAVVRWQMSGFNRTPGATEQPMTARNLMGQVDGTNNPAPGKRLPGVKGDFDSVVFVPEQGDPAWMAGGSYAVVRRIRMLLDNWDQLSLARQEKVIGRRKKDGAPLSGGGEKTPVDLGRRSADGSLAIAGDAHVRVAAPESNGGAAMLRRPFSFHDGFDSQGVPDAGLLFVAWQADPRRGFTQVQRKLDRGDGLSRFLRHEASALFAVPGGCEPGEYIGQRLLEG